MFLGGHEGECSRPFFPFRTLTSELLGGEALNSDGTLKDPKDIVWYHDKDDTAPISSGSHAPRMFFFLHL
jgi:hypothetical protein